MNRFLEHCRSSWRGPSGERKAPPGGEFRLVFTSGLMFVTSRPQRAGLRARRGGRPAFDVIHHARHSREEVA